jgi:hypothetical protein
MNPRSRKPFWLATVLALLLTACSTLLSTPPAVLPAKQPDAENHIPVILRIEERTENDNGRLLLHKDIYFTDPDGDATSVVNKLAATDPAGLHATWGDDPITVPAAEQKQIGLVTSTLGCPVTLYPVAFTVEDRLLDAAGNLSEPVTFRFACPANPPNSLPSLSFALVFGLGLLAGFWVYFRQRPFEGKPVILSTLLLFCALFPTYFTGSILHEGGHALASLSLRGTVWRLYVHPFTFAGFARPFIDQSWVHAGGYITNLLASFVIFCLIWKRRAVTNLPLVMLFPFWAIAQGLQILILNGDTANILRLTGLPGIIFIVLGFGLVCSGLFFLLALFPLLGLVPGDRKSLLVVPAAFSLHSLVSWLVAHWFVPGSTFDFQYVGVGAEMIETANLMAVIAPIIGGLFGVIYVTLFRRLDPQLPGWAQTDTASLTWKDLRLPALLAAVCVILGLLIIT